MRTGKISDKVLKRSILEPLKAVDLNNKDNSISMSTVTITVDSMLSVYIGVNKAVNGVVIEGALPMRVSFNISLPEDADERLLKDIVEYAAGICRELSVSVACGHTEVMSYITKPIMVVTCAGMKDESRVVEAARPSAGMHIVMTKAIAIEGTALLEEKFHERLLERFSERFLAECVKFRQNISTVKEAELAWKLTGADGGRLAADMINVSGGGVFAALWHIARKTSHGVEAYIKDIPVWQETIEITEFFNINPYQTASAGSVLMVTGDGEQLVERLGESGIPAAIIGKLTDNNDKVVMNGGERRFLESPGIDEIHKTD